MPVPLDRVDDPRGVELLEHEQLVAGEHAAAAWRTR